RPEALRARSRYSSACMAAKAEKSGGTSRTSVSPSWRALAPRRGWQREGRVPHSAIIAARIASGPSAVAAGAAGAGAGADGAGAAADGAGRGGAGAAGGGGKGARGGNAAAAGR